LNEELSMIYLDNAATSWPKPDQVYHEMMAFMRSGCANPGRSSHHLARSASKGVMKTRELLSELFHNPNPMDIAFTANATFALNMAIQGFLRKGDHVVTTAMEHNSVLRPLYHMKKYGLIDYTIVMPKNLIGEIDPGDVEAAIKPETRLIICTASSNVTGTIMPYVKIGEIAHERRIAYLVDAAQGAGVLDFDVEAMHIDMLAFPGHKGLLGPQGTGGLYVRPGTELRPIIFGGTGSRSFETVHPDFMPDMLEGGTVNTPGVIGLGAGVAWLLKKGTHTIKAKKTRLVAHLHARLSSHPGIKLFSSPDGNANSGIVAFLVNRLDSSETGNLLDSQYGIAVRSGFHCAPLAHQALGTMETGLVRVSPGFFNTLQDMENTATAVLRMANKG
jgi:cysteine desulfurase/selenocysteine lyase